MQVLPQHSSKVNVVYVSDSAISYGLGPVSRFGDTAANAGILALLESNSYMKKLPSLGKTVFASLAAAAFRMILTPIDTLKTTLQAQGQSGLDILKNRVSVLPFTRLMSEVGAFILQIKRYGLGTLWYGAFATAAATFVGHYPVSNIAASRMLCLLTVVTEIHCGHPS
jgi:hypothetical protein